MFKVKYSRYNPSNGEYTPHESRVYFSQGEASQEFNRLRATGADDVRIVRYIPTGPRAN